MSDTRETPGDRAPSQNPYSPPPPAKRKGWVTALMIVVGIVLLFPGLCAIVFANIAVEDLRLGMFRLGMFQLVCILIAVGGILLIRAAVKGRRR